MGLFNRRKSHEYQGFAKYADEYTLASQSPAAQNLQRAQSLSSASRAAAAALQIHQKQPVPNTPPVRTGANRAAYRSNSLGGYGRTALINLYTYTPRASYSTGPPPAAPSAQRTLSLRLNSLASGGRPGPRRSFVPGPVFPEEAEDDGDVVVTTKTTKVLDAQGRTRSISTETVRHMPDGLNIIETKTTNISRPTSRANSLQASVLGPPPAASAYSLDKIDEDLHDFESTYLDHVPPRIAGSASTYGNSASREAATVSPRRPKSILKSGASAATAAAAVAAVTAGSGRANTSPVPSELRSPEPRRQPLHQTTTPLQPAPDLEPAPRLNSMASGGTSIKFLDKVETIPYTYTDSYRAENHENLREIANEERHMKEQALQNNRDLYNKAMQVAAENVYGSPQSAALSSSPKQNSLQKFAEKKSEKKLKNDEKLSKKEASGISKNYVYTNHHTDFSVRSLRNSGVEHQTSRKERAREEKRLLKEEEKKHAEWLKAAEKERKIEEREAQKREKLHFSLFKRNRRRSSAGDSSLASVNGTRSNSSEQAASSAALGHNRSALELLIPDQIIQEEQKLSSSTGNAANGPKQARTIALVDSEQKTPEAADNPVNINYESATRDSERDATGETSLNPELVKAADLNADFSTRLVHSQTFDEEDEFVDVPDNLYLSPLFDTKAALKPENGSLKINSNTAVVKDPLPVSKRTSVTEIPKRGDLEFQPGDTLPQQEIIPPEELATLVSEDNGRPQVLKNSDNQVLQPRKLDSLIETVSVHTSSAARVPGNQPNKSSDEYLKDSSLQPYTSKNSFVSPELNIENHHESHQGSVETSSGSTIDVSKVHKHDHEVDSNHMAHSKQSAPEVKDSEAIPKVKNKKKEGGRFKRAIEKYFLNTYSR